MQKRTYRALYEQNWAVLGAGIAKKHMPSLNNLFMQLRKVCNHPYLIKGVQERVRMGYEGVGAGAAAIRDGKRVPMSR